MSHDMPRDGYLGPEALDLPAPTDAELLEAVQCLTPHFRTPDNGAIMLTAGKVRAASRLLLRHYEARLAQAERVGADALREEAAIKRAAAHLLDRMPVSGAREMAIDLLRELAEASLAASPLDGEGK